MFATPWVSAGIFAGRPAISPADPKIVCRAGPAKISFSAARALFQRPRFFRQMARPLEEPRLARNGMILKIDPALRPRYLFMPIFEKSAVRGYP
jgi:hypothetical protein